MNLAEIQRRLRGGFKRFAIRLSDGRTYDVPHPEFVFVTGRSIAVTDKEGFIEVHLAGKRH